MVGTFYGDSIVVVAFSPMIVVYALQALRYCYRDLYYNKNARHE